MNAAEVVAAVDFGQATAAKRGRDPRFPYVPVIRQAGRQVQVLGLAYATREEAVVAGERHIVRLERDLLARLNDPRCRALRESYGLPREVTS